MSEYKQEASREEKCPQCGKVMESPVPRKIIAIDFDPVRRKKFVGEKMKNFCSQECGAYYQMGCEG
jgi:endogenous inhibitor of DNA gyrase (YacG/DUF329 family)